MRCLLTEIGIFVAGIHYNSCVRVCVSVCDVSDVVV